MREQLRTYLGPLSTEYLSLTVCQGTVCDYVRFLDDLGLGTGGEYALALLGSEAPEMTPHKGLRVFRDDAIAGDDFLRSALRQDPDALVLDCRAERTDPDLLWTAKQTGHRVIVHCLSEATKVFATSVEFLDRRLPGCAGQMMRHEVYLALGTSGEAERLWQIEMEENGSPILVEVGWLEEGAWRFQRGLTSRSAPVPLPEAETIIAVPKEWPTRTETLLEELRRALGPLRRLSWGPVKGDAGPDAVSRFGGAPRLQEGEAWPCCGACRAKMPLVLQIGLDSAPSPFQEELGSEGLFQFFYCTSPKCDAERAWEPFGPNSLARVVLHACVEVEPESCALTPMEIAGWTPIEEGPSWEERSQHWPADQELSGDCLEAIVKLARGDEKSEELQRVYAEVFTYFGVTSQQISELGSLLRTAQGDKLLGWPAWTQAPEYPQCPDCAQPMRMLVQINNDGPKAAEPGEESTYGQLFAADGNGHVYHCHGHLTFSWAC